MTDLFNYNILLNQAMKKVRNIRDPKSEKQEYVYYGFQEVQNKNVVSIGGSSHQIYVETTEKARKITVECLEAILIYLFKYYNYEVESVERAKIAFKVQFAILDKKNSTLWLFKEPQCDLSIITSRFILDEITKAKKHFNVQECFFVYLMYENAHQQFLNYKTLGDAINKNIFSLHSLFDRYFGIEEFVEFQKCFTNYTKVVNDYLGFSIIKTLTPVAQVNFAKIVQYRLINFDYNRLLEIEMHNKKLSESCYMDIRTKYFDNNLYFIMLGTGDYSESLITAEWMYDSMKKAQAIDLTVVGMGYLKAIEQLIYSIILLHKNEDRDIKSNLRHGVCTVKLNDAQIDNGEIDSTIGALANFCKDNPDIFRSTLQFKAKRYVTEAIFVFKDIRNGYFHKYNICEWSKINEIRDITYYLAFLLLGSLELTEENKMALGFPQEDFISDKYRLCEYIHVHAGDGFILCFDESSEVFAIAQRDPQVAPINNLFMRYSGAYFSQCGKSPKNIFTDMPTEIYLCRIEISAEKEIQLTPIKTKLIFSGGKFVGPTLFEEGVLY